MVTEQDYKKAIDILYEIPLNPDDVMRLLAKEHPQVLVEIAETLLMGDKG